MYVELINGELWANRFFSICWRTTSHHHYHHRHHHRPVQLNTCARLPAIYHAISSRAPILSLHTYVPVLLDMEQEQHLNCDGNNDMGSGERVEGRW